MIKSMKMSRHQANEYVETFDEGEFRTIQPGKSMLLWQMFASIPGNWKFAQYSHFFDADGDHCYSVRYNDIDDITRQCDVDWDNHNTPFKKAQIIIK